MTDTSVKQDDVKTLTQDARKPLVAVWMPCREFLLPYLEREFTDYELVAVTDDCLALSADVQAAVMISDVDVYSRKEGLDISEIESVDTESPWYKREQLFGETCAGAGIPASVLRCVNVVGTGMQADPMRLARAIWRGWPLHLSDNQAVKSVVHAVDVAAVARLAAFNPCVINLTDGTETPIDELIEALAYRIKNKRVGSLGKKLSTLVKFVMGAENYRLLTTSVTYSSERLRTLFPDFKANCVVEYLKSHVYDDESL